MIKKPNKIKESCKKEAEGEPGRGEGRRHMQLRISTPAPVFLLPLGGLEGWEGERGALNSCLFPLPFPRCSQLQATPPWRKKLNGGIK